jgi:putative aminopeptidase FrvX
MDELGLVVTRIEENGMLRFKKVGGIDDRPLVGRVINVVISKGSVKGVIGLPPPHLMKDPVKEMDRVLMAEELAIDIGCGTRNEAEDLGIKVMDTAVFEKCTVLLNGKMLSARGLDDRFGCATLLEILRRVSKKNLKVRVTFVWNVQEEVGLRGARVAVLKEMPDYVIAVDTYSATDIPGAPEHSNEIALGKGPVVRYMDNGSIASPKLVKFVQGIAVRKKIPLQIGITGGSTAQLLKRQGL